MACRAPGFLAAGWSEHPVASEHRPCAWGVEVEREEVSVHAVLARAEQVFEGRLHVGVKVGGAERAVFESSVAAAVSQLALRRGLEEREGKVGHACASG